LRPTSNRGFVPVLLLGLPSVTRAVQERSHRWLCLTNEWVAPLLSVICDTLQIDDNVPALGVKSKVIVARRVETRWLRPRNQLFRLYPLWFPARGLEPNPQ
jgi:hypothetical protein